jgi:hypothetical protein
MRLTLRTLRTWGVLGWGAVVLVACSSGGTGSVGSGGGAATGESFIDQYCALYAPCCQKAGLRTDGVACKALGTYALSQHAYDPASGGQCLSELRASSSAPDFCAKRFDADSCDRAFGSGSGGTNAPGAECASDSECASSTEGKVSCAFASGGKRFCQVQIDGKAGDTPCLGTRDGSITSFEGSSGDPASPPSRGFICDVEDGVRCDGTSHTCVALVAEGSPCAGSNGCVATAYCDGQTCVKRLAAGADCSHQSSACERGAVCDPNTQQCKALADDGEACSTGNQCASHICASGKCGGVGVTSSVLCGAP